MISRRLILFLAAVLMGTPRVGLGEGQGHMEFWKRVTNGFPPIEYYYARSLGEHFEATKTSYTPALIVFHVKMQHDGLKIRFSDKLAFTNSHQIKESFHFAVGGFQSNLWSMGASKQITHATIDPVELSAPEPIFRIVAAAKRMGSSSAVSQPIAQKPRSTSPVVQTYRAQREDARKVFHLGLPSLVRDSLVVSADSFKALTEAHGPIEGKLYHGERGGVEKIEYRLTDTNFRKQLVYKYEGGNPLPSEFNERTISSRTNTMQISYKMLGAVRFSENAFAPEELMPHDYYAQNSDLRTFAEKNGQKFTVGAKGQLTPVQTKTTQTKPKSRTLIQFVLGTICLVSVIVLVKQIKKNNDKQTT